MRTIHKERLTFVLEALFPPTNRFFLAVNRHIPKPPFKTKEVWMNFEAKSLSIEGGDATLLVKAQLGREMRGGRYKVLRDHESVGMIQTQMLTPQLHNVQFTVKYEELEPLFRTLADRLGELFHVEARLEGVPIVPGGEANSTRESPKRIVLQRFPPGRKRDPLYDEAFERLRKGEQTDEVYKWYCDEAGLTTPDKGTRDAFKAAMKRR